MERRVILKYRDGTSLLTANPFKIADEIRCLVGDVEGAKPSNAGALVIQAASEAQVDQLLRITEFLGRSASFEAPGSTIEAYAYAPSLSGVEDEELLTDLREQGVVGVTRLRKKNGKNNPGMRLRFRGGTYSHQRSVPGSRRSSSAARRCSV